MQTVNYSNLLPALMAVQKEVKNIQADKDNPFFGSRYASLATVRDTLVPIFHRHGLLLLQEVGTGQLGPSITTHIFHVESSELLSLGPAEFAVSKKDPQGYAAAITYMRRVLLLAAAGVTGVDDDDDAESAVERPAQAPKTAAAKEVARSIHKVTLGR